MYFNFLFPVPLPRAADRTQDLAQAGQVLSTTEPHNRRYIIMNFPAQLGNPPYNVWYSQDSLQGIIHILSQKKGLVCLQTKKNTWGKFWLSVISEDYSKNKYFNRTVCYFDNVFLIESQQHFTCQR